MNRKIANLPRLASLALAAMLGGCTTAAPAPVRVEVPVMVPCIAEVPPRPAYEFAKLPATATDGEIILALAQDWARGRLYEGELDAIIEGCLSVASPPSVQVQDMPPRPTPTALRRPCSRFRRRVTS